MNLQCGNTVKIFILVIKIYLLNLKCSKVLTLYSNFSNENISEKLMEPRFLITIGSRTGAYSLIVNCYV